MAFTHDRFTIMTYRLCYNVESEGVQREWDFATEAVANIARNALLLRYPSAQVRTNTACYSSHVPDDLQCYQSRLRWLQSAKEQEERLLSRSEPA